MSRFDRATLPCIRHKLTISYDGTAYSGWQIQQNGVTVQQRLQEKLGLLVMADVKVHGSGRTDQGVHARGQVAHVDLRSSLSCSSLRRGLNATLPDDIRVLKVEHVPSDFHARRSAVSKQYRYHIWDGAIVPPWLRQYRTCVPGPLDLAGMRRAASVLVGRHDFASFTANPKRLIDSTVRTVSRLELVKHGHDITIIAEGEGFLYKMVRSLAGWLIRVGKGEVEAAETADILASCKRTPRVTTAPPQGLFLWQVTY